MSTSFSATSTTTTSSTFPASSPSAASMPEELLYLCEDYLPDAHFIAGGGLRFDTLLRLLRARLNQLIKVRRLDDIVGHMPCLWSLDWHQQESRMPLERYTAHIELYTREDVGFCLCFDNPFIRESDLEDKLGLYLVQELASRNRHGKHSLCVAHDGLRERLQKTYPQLPIHCHPNRIIAHEAKRDARMYERLAQKYNRVALHPADGVKMSLCQQLADKDKYVIILNDPCLRTCPVRKQHLSHLAKWRQEPYQHEHFMACKRLIQNTKCMEASTLLSGQSANLSVKQIKELYAMGYRHFAFQSQRFNSPISFFNDLIYGLFTPSSAHTQQVATIRNAVLHSVSNARKESKSGMMDFAQL